MQSSSSEFASARAPGGAEGGPRAAATGTGGFVPVRLDLPVLLGEPTGRREAHHLAALGVAVDLAEQVDWRTNTLNEFRVTAWAEGHGMAFRRVRRALDHLAAAGVAQFDLHPFRPGQVTLTPRSEPTSLLHDQSRTDEKFVPVARGALEALASEHGLSWTAKGLLRALLLLCDRAGELPEGWTKTSLGEYFGVGWRRLSAALNELGRAGLIAFQARRGRPLQLRLLARPALVAALPGARLRRRERRRVRREAARGSGPAAELADQLYRHFGLAAPLSPALVAALSDALVAGVPARALAERVAARGRLNGATDPVAVLVARCRQVKDELLAARQAAEQRREEAAEARRLLAAAQAEEELRRAVAAGEDRWLAAALPRLPSASELGVAGVAAHPVLRAAQIRLRAAELAAAYPDRDPAALLARWAAAPCPPGDLDIAGVAPRDEAIHGPPGRLPQAREGPSLLARLRNENA